MTKHVSILDLDKSVKPLLSKVCWEVDWSNLDNLSLKFGKPRIKILREPYKTKSRNKGVRRQASRRLVSVIGYWKLWIYLAHWRIVRFGKTLTTGSSSYQKKFMAMQELGGQQLVGICVARQHGATRFEFDLDTVLEVRRYNCRSTDELWLLYGDDGYERSVHGDGTFWRERYEETKGKHVMEDIKKMRI